MKRSKLGQLNKPITSNAPISKTNMTISASLGGKLTQQTIERSQMSSSITQLQNNNNNNGSIQNKTSPSENSNDKNSFATTTPNKSSFSALNEQQQQKKIEEKVKSVPIISLEKVFPETQKHLRSTIRELLRDQQYNKIDFCFEDERIDSKDCIMFQPQIGSLSDLTFRFAKTKDFTEETLDFLRFLPLSNLNVLQLVFVIGLDHSIKTHINYSIFFLQNIPNIKIYFIPYTDLLIKLEQLTPSLEYNKESGAVPVVFSRFGSLTKIDIEILEVQIEKYLPKSIKITLEGKPSESSPTQNTWFEKLGNSLSKLESLQVNFSNCQLSANHIKSFLEGLSKVPKDKSYETNTFIKQFKLNYQGCSAIDQSVIQVLGNGLKDLKYLDLIFDKERQIFNQYEKLFLFSLIRFITRIPQINLLTSHSNTVYNYDLNLQQLSISIKNMQISPFQLIDVKKAINLHKTYSKLECDLSDNFKLSFRNILRFFDECVALKQSPTCLESLVIDLRNTNISEIECLCIYLNIINTVPVNRIQFHTDFDINSFLEVRPAEDLLFLHHIGETLTSSNPPFSWKVHFIFSQLEKLKMFKKKVHIQFFYNYRLTPQIFEAHIIPFILNDKQVETLILDFNHCCFEASEVYIFITIICNTIKSILFQDNSTSERKPNRYFTLNLNFLNNNTPKLQDVIDIYSEFICNSNSIVKSFSILTDEFQLEKAALTKKIEQNHDLASSNINFYYPFITRAFTINKKILLVPKKLYLAKIAPEKEPLDFSFQLLHEIDDDEEVNDNQSIYPRQVDETQFEIQCPKRDRPIQKNTSIKRVIIIFTPEATKQKIEHTLKEIAEKHQFQSIIIPEEESKQSEFETYYKQLVN